MDEKQQRLVEIVERIHQLNPEEEAFPYEDCFLVKKQAGEQSEGLIPDLDMYFYNIWSITTMVHKLPTRTRQELEERKSTLSQDFFAMHPTYVPLKPLITSETTPTLFRYLEVHNEMRLLGLEAIEIVLKLTS